MKFFIRLLLTTTALISCNLDAAELKISSEIMYRYCTEYFGLVNVTFENKSADWVEVQSVDISFGNPEYDQKVAVVTGERLLAWYDSITAKLESDAFYSRLLLGTIITAGSVISRERGSDLAGAVALGSFGVLTIKELGAIKDRIELGQVVPRTHLLSGKFSVPPEFSASRWILFNTKKNDGLPVLTEFDITLALDGGRTQTEKTRFRRSSNSCTWQTSENS